MRSACRLHYAVEPPRRQHQSSLVEQFVRGHNLVVRRKYHRLGIPAGNQKGMSFVPFPLSKGRPAPFQAVDLHPVASKFLEDTGENLLCRAKRMIRGINQVHAENADRFLLLQVAGIHQVDMQNDVVWRIAGLAEKAQSHPPVTVIGSCKVPCRDRVHKRRKTWCRLHGWPGAAPAVASTHSPAWPAGAASKHNESRLRKAGR